MLKERLAVFLIFFLFFYSLQHFYRMEKKEKETFKRLSLNFGHLLLAKAVFLILFFYWSFDFFDHENFFYQSYVSHWVLSFALLDLGLYLQHRVSHAVPLFWRLHRVHHSDTMLTTSTAVRFHFLEILFSFFWKMFLVVVFGIEFQVYIAFEIFLNACALFNHSNLKLPNFMDKALSFVLITPNLHRLHHSTQIEQSNKNFGFSTVLWDKLFKSFSELRPKSVGVLGMKGEGFSEQILLCQKEEAL